MSRNPRDDVRFGAQCRMSSPFVRYFTFCAATVLALVSIGISAGLIVPLRGAGLIAIIGLVVIAAGVAIYRWRSAKRAMR